MNKNQKQVMKYIQDNQIPLVANNVIWVGIQESCKMATVELNGKCVMMGNFWDFHNDCHGMKVPEFSNYRELSLIFKDALIAANQEVELVVNSKWNYEEYEECEGD